RLLAGELTPDVGRVKRGRTVALAHLSQALDEVDESERVLDSVQAIRRVTRTAEGEVTATALLERFGFTGDRLTARLGDLSGGERRRFQLLKLLLTEPNVLLFDEPTNDLDIETLTVLEDFLDGWPGTLVVVSHDRYFLERVTDSVWALMGDGQVVMLPRGVEEYLERRAASTRASAEGGRDPVGAGSGASPSSVERGRDPELSPAEQRELRKTMERLERQIAKLDDRIAALQDQMLEAATDHERLTALDAELRAATAAKDEREEEWLAVA